VSNDLQLVALRQAGLLLLVVVGYIVVSRRFKLLQHPMTIAFAVAVVGVAVSVVNEFFRGGWTGVPRMAVRAGVGSVMWGLVIGGGYWLVRTALGRASRGRRGSEPTKS
jgi:hypothetical protein